MSAVSPLWHIRKELEGREERLFSPHATLSRSAVRRRPDASADTGHRLQFAVDADRILHSLAYTRYIDKTQVFYLVDNDHISHRVLHVQLLSKIGRTIGRLLRLNEDLIEAIALGHDIGHPPFGHDGETFLDRLAREHGLPPFQHSIQSIRFLEEIERGGRGWNLTLQVLDGILCHDGETLIPALRPAPRPCFEDFQRDFERKRSHPDLDLPPGTMEGAVVRLADVISYVGRDMEDAVRLRLIRRQDIPEEVRGSIGDTNGVIVYRLVEDLARNSLDSDVLCFSPATAEALEALLRFNRERIYANPLIKTEQAKIERLYRELFEAYVEDVEKEHRHSELFTDFLEQMDSGYVPTSSPAEIVRDFLAGMTDDYFLKCARKRVLPGKLPARFHTGAYPEAGLGETADKAS